ncbi:DUF4062 domain-containing protein [Geothrix sp. SG200]|uniref:DUF4062 domain-containing protein n=1 Tax=Geothrix sp. SG200 TaxID=2922865 RepID=UPI001FABA12D|nr:DUF4062 domain-containing protein [Geothrix sp. SG200]
MEKRFQVFVSSTFLDLQKERQAAQKAILGLNHMPAGMELFPATDDSAWQLICDVINISDYYVIIIGGKYGSIDEAGISYTEREYEYALSREIPVIPLLHKDPKELPRNKTEESAKLWKKVDAFRKRIEKRHHCSYWQTEDDLQAKLIVALIDSTKRNPRTGWIKSDAIASSEATKEILDLRKTIDSLQKELADLKGLTDRSIEDLAQGKDTHDIDINFTLSKHGAPWGSPERMFRGKDRLRFNWDEIFSLIGPLVIEVCPDTQVKAAITKHFKDRYKSVAQSKYPDREITSLSITESEFQKIKVQFLALGLITFCQISPSPESPGRMVRACQITQRGQLYLINSTAIRRPKGRTKSV